MTEIEILRQKHADVFNNPAVKQISSWRQPNSDEPFKKEVYDLKAKNNIGKLLGLFESVNSK